MPIGCEAKYLLPSRFLVISSCLGILGHVSSKFIATSSSLVPLPKYSLSLTHTDTPTQIRRILQNVSIPLSYLTYRTWWQEAPPDTKELWVQF